MVVSGTGHRAFCRDAYSRERFEVLCAFVRRVIRNLKRDHGEFTVISGVALGFDLALARAAMEEGLPLIAAVPCPNQVRPGWQQFAKDLHAQALAYATEVHVLSKTYSPEAMTSRNCWMVDRSDVVLALYDETRCKSGTGHCVRYAKDRGVRCVRLWDAWSRYAGE